MPWTITVTCTQTTSRCTDKHNSHIDREEVFQRPLAFITTTTTRNGWNFSRACSIDCQTASYWGSCPSWRRQTCSSVLRRASDSSLSAGTLARTGGSSTCGTRDAATKCWRWSLRGCSVAWVVPWWIPVCPLSNESSAGMNGVEIVNTTLPYLFSYNLPMLSSSSTSNGLSDKSLGAISRRCPELTHLQVQSSNEVYDSGVSEVLNMCTNLQHLDLTGCPHVANLFGGHEVLQRRFLLQYLDLTDCVSIDDCSLQNIVRHCPSLVYLYLRRCVQITGKIILLFNTLPRLILHT